MDLDISQVLSSTLAMIKSRFGPLLGLWAIFLVIQIALFVILAMVGGVSATSLASGGDPSALMSGGFIVGILVFYVVYILIYCAQSLSMSKMASPLYDGDFVGAFATGFKRALTLFGVYILMIIAFSILSFFMGLIGEATGGEGSTGSNILGLLLFIAMVFFACRFAVLSPTIAVDDVRNPIKGIAQTWSMTAGNALKILLLFVLFGVIALIVLAGLYLAFASSFTSLAMTDDPSAVLGVVGPVLAVFLIVSALFSIIGAALISSMHAGLTTEHGENLQDTFE